MVRLLRLQQALKKLSRLDNFLNNEQEKAKIIAQINEYAGVIGPLFEAAGKTLTVSDKLNTDNIDKILQLNASAELYCTSKLYEIEDQISIFENNPAKYNRIAVVLVGHYRTIKQCLPYQIRFFNQMATVVDYYFVTWETNDYAESDIIRNKSTPLTRYDLDIKLNIFGSLLKGHRFVEELMFPNFRFMPDNNYGLWKVLRLTYLAKIAQQLKKEYETKNNFIYDQVIETRPDLFFHPRDDYDRHHLIDCGDNMILTDSTRADESMPWDALMDQVGEFHNGNWYWRMNSRTYDSFSDRYDFFRNFLTQYPADDAIKETFKAFHSCMASYFLTRPQFKFVKGKDFLDTKPVQLASDLP